MSEEDQSKENRLNLSGKKWRWQINIPIFLFFLVISSIFWLLNSLNREYSTTMRFKVHYINPPRNKAITGDENQHISVVLKGHGYTLLRIMATERQTSMLVDLEATYYHRFDEQGRYYYLASGIRDAVQNQLGSEVQVVSLQPDTIQFSLTGSIKKRIKVEAKLDLQLEKQFLIKGKPVCTPDTLTVSGPSGIVDTLSVVYTKMQQVKHLNKTIELTVDIDRNDQLSYSRDQVTAVVPVEKYTEAMVKVPIQATNLPAGLRLKTFPHEATLVFNVPLSDYDKLNPSLFEVVVDYRDLARKKGNRMDLFVRKYPEFAYALKCSPESVEFIVE